MALPNASQLDQTPDRSVATHTKLAKSPPLFQIIDATLQDNSAVRMSVSSPDPVKDGIEPKQSNLNLSDKLNKSMLVGVLENQARQLAKERDDLLEVKAKLQAEIDDQKATIGQMAVKVKEEDQYHEEAINEYDEYIEYR